MDDRVSEITDQYAKCQRDSLPLAQEPQGGQENQRADQDGAEHRWRADQRARPLMMERVPRLEDRQFMQNEPMQHVLKQ